MSSKFKGGMAAAAFLLIALLAITPKAIAGNLIYGDATLTGLPVDGADVGLVQQCVSNAAACPGNADTTGNDCKIAASDVLALQRYLVFLDLPALPAKNPGAGPPACWAVSLSGDPVTVSAGGSVPVTATLVINVAPPRGGLDCAGVVVDFDCSLCPPGTTVDPSAVTDGSCNAIATVNAGGTPGVGEIIASVDLRDTGGGLLNQVTVQPSNITITVTPPQCSISSVVPATGCLGEPVTITGLTFGAVEGTVEFDATTATVTLWTDTSIVVSAPGGTFSNVMVAPPSPSPSCNFAGAYSYDGVAPAAPTIAPVSGEYCSGQAITVTTAEGGPEDCTTDGSAPDCNSGPAPATITVDMTLRCIECDACNNPSPEDSEVYTVDVTDPTATINLPVEAGDYATPITADIVCSEAVPPGICDERYDGGTWQACGTSTPLGNGAHTIDARCTDGCGNVGPIQGPVNFNIIDCDCPAGGAAALIQSLPRNGPGNLPPDSVTGNMPVAAPYLKFVYDEQVDISGASENLGGTLVLETTTCNNDTVVWNGPALSYETDYNLVITGVVDCDEGNPLTDINLDLRTARDVVADGMAQSGEGFLDGSLAITVVDDMDGTPIADAVVQINNTVQWDDPGWVNDVYYTDAGGAVMFGLGPVTLNQPITITVMAPGGYQYLTWYEQDAREVTLGLRLRGEGIAAKQETYIIGDMDTAGLNNGIHPYQERGGIPNPIRLGLASLGFHKRTMSTLAVEDILGPYVQHQLSVLGEAFDAAIPSNLFLTDFVVGRNDAPAGFQPRTFMRLKTDRTGDLYLNIIGATANVQDIDLPSLLAGTADLIDVLVAAKLTGACGDIRRITVPDTGPGTCLTMIMDTTNRGVTQDPMGGPGAGCTNIANTGVRFVLDHYGFGWNGQGQTGAVTWTEPGFTFARALRVNMSNWPDDADIVENFYARLTCVDHNNQPAPCVIPVLELAVMRMDDETDIGVGLSMVNFEDGGVASKLFGFPDITQLEADLSVSGLEVGAAAAAFDWETRFILTSGRNLVDNPDPHSQCTVGPCYQHEVAEWMQWVYGMSPPDPGVSGRNHTGYPATSPANDLVNRMFEVPELISSDDGAHPDDPDFNSELLMARLIDAHSGLASCLDPSFVQVVSDDAGVWSDETIDNPVWRFYAPAKVVPGTVQIHLPPVPTVADIDALLGCGTCQAYTFESPTVTQTGIPNGFELSWVHNAINLPTTANINNLVERDTMMYDVYDLSQNRQRFIFQRP